MSPRRFLVTAVVALAACRDNRPATIRPVLSLDPLSLDFGNAKVGRTSTAQVKLLAATNAALHVTAMRIDGEPAFSVDPAPLTIEPFGSLQLPVGLKPAEARLYAGTLVISSDDEEHPELSVGLRGQGATPQIAVTPASITFPPEPADRMAEPPPAFWPAVRIESTGLVELDIASITIEGADAASFAVVGPVPTTLAAGRSADVHVKIDTTPAQIAYAAVLVIRSDDPAKPEVRVPLAGTLGANFPPFVCANVTRVRPGDGSATVDYGGWAPAPDAGYDFTRSREIPPGSIVELSAWSSTDVSACTSDPEDHRLGLTYLWEVVSAAPGPAPVLTGAMTANPRFVPLATGAYRLKLTVADVQGHANAVLLDLAVAHKQDLAVQLSWVGAANVDLDVHLVRPGAAPFAFFSGGVAGRTSGDLNGWAMLQRTPDSGFDFDWGEPGRHDDPRLNIDDTGTGALLENVSLNYPANAPECAAGDCRYGIYVHWFRDARASGGPMCTVTGDGDPGTCSGGQRCVANVAPMDDAGTGAGTCRDAVKPVVRVFVRGAPAAVVPLDTLMSVDPFALGAPCQLWHAADVVWPARGSDAGVTVDAIGRDATGYVTAPQLSRYGWRPGAFGQCSPNVMLGGVPWYTAAP